MAGNSDIPRGVPTLAILGPNHVVVGDILKWRRRGDTWEARVTHEVDDGEMITEWLPVLVLARLATP
jgi:hypothetical protein